MISTLIPGQLTICSSASFPPICYKKPSGEVVGLDLSFLKLFADTLGLKIFIIEKPFENIWTLPNMNACDIAAGSIMADKSRIIGPHASWSDDYFATSRSLIVRAKEKDSFDNYSKLKSKKIVVTRGSVAEWDAKVRYPNCIIEYIDEVEHEHHDDVEYLIKSVLLKKEVDAFAAGEIANRFLRNKYNDDVNGRLALADVHTYDHKSDSFNFVVRNASQGILEQLNIFIAMNKELYKDQVDHYLKYAKKF